MLLMHQDWLLACKDSEIAMVRAECTMALEKQNFLAVRVKDADNIIADQRNMMHSGDKRVVERDRGWQAFLSTAASVA